MAPIWFDSNNRWAAQGATLIAVGQGTINDPGDAQTLQIRHHGQQPPSGPGQWCAAGAINGISTTPPEHFGYVEPRLRISGFEDLGGHDYPKYGNWGRNVESGFDPVFGNAVVTWVQTGPDGEGPNARLWIPDEDGDYPKNVDGVAAFLEWRGPVLFPGNVMSWTGQYYIELYDLPQRVVEPGTDPGPADPPCPPYPAWPYPDPVVNASPPPGARIRRSRP